MESNNTNDSVSESISVGVPQEKAFYAFAQQMTSWWPRRYTWSGDNLNHIVLDPEQGAAWYEVSESGERQSEWGKLLTWEPPHRLVLSWMVGAKRVPETDPSHASEVEVTFTAEGEHSTRVEVNHRGFASHGEAWEAYRDGMQSPEGWQTILSAYADYLQQQERQYEDMEQHRLAS
ncbi:MAG: SRPBCC family protein [Dehalococcoidia bacterium]